MKKTVIIATIISLCVSLKSYAQQDYATLFGMGATPQLNTINPAYMPHSSYLSVPFIGGISFQATNPFSYNRVIDNSKTVNLNKIKDNSRLNFGANLDIINFGVKFKDKHMVTMGIRTRSLGGITYPTGAFDFIEANPIGTNKTFNVDLRNMALAWGEIAVSYTYEMNRNWSFGAKAKYLMGAASINTADSNVTLDKTLSSYTVGGDINFMLGNYNAQSNEFSTSGLTKNGGFSADLGAFYRSDDQKWTVSFSILDLGFINWNAEGSSRVYSKNPDARYDFDGFGDLQDVLDNGDFNDLLNNTYDDILASMGLDTASCSFKKMIPTTIHIGGTYTFDNTMMHTISGNMINTFYAGHPYSYSLTAAYTYMSKNQKFRAMGSLTNRRHDPLAIGAGVMGCSKGFQFFIMGDISVAAIGGMKNARGLGFRMGMNVLLGKDRGNKRVTVI